MLHVTDAVVFVNQSRFYLRTDSDDLNSERKYVLGVSSSLRIRPGWEIMFHRGDKTGSTNLWQTFVSAYTGAQIPVIVDKSM